MTDLLLSLADAPLLGLPLPTIWFAFAFFVLGAFLFLDGFDFGVGALFALRPDHADRETMLAAVGPFWDGNEVWLVVFGGVLFAAFPPLYATLFSRHFLLMFAILGALVLRGLAPEFYEQRHDDPWRRWWGRSFVAGSVLAPLLLGVFVGNWVVGAERSLTLPGLLVGLATLALCVVDGAAFLALKTRGPLRRDAPAYGIRAAVGYLLFVVLAVGAMALDPGVAARLASPLVVAAVVVSVAAVAAYVLAAHRGRHYVAFGAVAVTVAAFVTLAGGLVYPVLDPRSGLTLSDAVVTTLPLNLMTLFSVVLVPMVLGYFAVLYSTFSGPADPEESY